jgi:hypothetical protein
MSPLKQNLNLFLSLFNEKNGHYQITLFDIDFLNNFFKKKQTPI